MNDCIFCRIVSKQIPAKMVYENDEIVAFDDNKPQAPVHVIIIPKEHIPTAQDLDLKHKDVIADMVLTAGEIAKKRRIALSGYRLVINCNKGAGQEVFHLHMHLIGGRPMAWPPG